MVTATPEPDPIRVLVVDDHALLREGIASALADESDLRLVGEAADGRSAILKFREHRPDVTLMDIQLPDISGIEALRIIRAEFPQACVIMLTTYRGDAQIREALQQGAMGFLLKTALRKELKDAIRKAHKGRRVMSPDVASELAEHLSEDQLTPRELEVLRIAAQGRSNKEIGADLQVSEDTIKAHMKSILAKLGAADRTHAVVTALKRGIIHLLN
jgi:DNA-binding NarL/FixJ family response regulator